MVRTPEGPQRVFVMGGGVVSPQGLDWDSSWRATLNGELGIQVIPDGFPYSPSIYDPRKVIPRSNGNIVRHGGIITADLHPETALVNIKNARRRGRNAHLVALAAQQAVEQSGIELIPRLSDADDMPDHPDNLRAAQRIVTIGMGLGDGMNVIDAHLKVINEELLAPTSAFHVEPEQAATTLCQLYNFQGPGKAVILACASGGAAIIDVAKAIRNREATMGIAGAGDTFARTVAAYAIYQAADALASFAPDEDLDPFFASMPFDARRRGFVHAEGAAAAFLEGEDSIRERGAEDRILAEVIGWGESNDGSPIGRDSEPKVRGQLMSMYAGARMAGINPTDVDYVSAHGTGTPLGDVCEFTSIMTFRGNNASNFHISGTKSMTGHGISWTGVKEFLDCVRAVRENVVPPTPNHGEMMTVPQQLIDRWGLRQDYRDLGLVPNVPVYRPIGVAGSNTFGFGGNDNTVYVRKFEGF